MHQLHFQTTSWVKFAAPDLSVICIETALTLCLNLDQISLLRGNPSFQKGKVTPLNALFHINSPGCALVSATYKQNKRMYITCKIYILRGLSVLSHLWLWKHLYLNTTCKLIFQNNRIIKMRRKKGRENIKYSCTSKKIQSSYMSCGYRIFRVQNMPWQFSELFCAQVPLWELGLATVMAFGNRQIIAGKNRGKEQEDRKMSARVLFYLPKPSLERAWSIWDRKSVV